MTVPSPTTDRGPVAFARRRPLTAFFVLAYGVTWLLWSPVVFRDHPGRPGVRRFVERLMLWRVGWVWFAVAVLLIPVGEVVVTALLGMPDALGAFSSSALLLYPAAYVAHFYFGPLFEESGWRGFALPRMQHRFGPARGTLLLGLLWSAWHFFLLIVCVLGAIVALVATRGRLSRPRYRAEAEQLDLDPTAVRISGKAVSS